MEIALQIGQLIMTFIIGVIISLHLGKFEYQKRRREKLITSLIDLNQSIQEFIIWHQNHIDKYIRLRMFGNIWNTFNHISITYKELQNIQDNVFDFVLNNPVMRNQYPKEITKDFQINSSFYIYQGKNPIFYLELLLLSLNRKEYKKLKNVSEKLREKIIFIEDSFYKLTCELDDSKIISDFENFKSELNEIILGCRMNYITPEETSEQIIDLVTHYSAKTRNTNNHFTLNKIKIFEFNTDFKNLIRKL